MAVFKRRTRCSAISILRVYFCKRGNKADCVRKTIENSRKIKTATPHRLLLLQFGHVLLLPNIVQNFGNFCFGHFRRQLVLDALLPAQVRCNIRHLCLHTETVRNKLKTPPQERKRANEPSNNASYVQLLQELLARLNFLSQKVRFVHNVLEVLLERIHHLHSPIKRFNKSKGDG